MASRVDATAASSRARPWAVTVELYPAALVGIRLAREQLLTNESVDQTRCAGQPDAQVVRQTGQVDVRVAADEQQRAQLGHCQRRCRRGAHLAPNGAHDERHDINDRCGDVGRTQDRNYARRIVRIANYNDDDCCRSNRRIQSRLAGGPSGARGRRLKSEPFGGDPSRQAVRLLAEEGRSPVFVGRFARSTGSGGRLRGGGGEGGIRTLDGLPHTAFPVPRPRPLGDLSAGDDGPDQWEMAERVGFEPTVLSHTAFRERHLQPLGHLSAARGYQAARGWACARGQARAAGARKGGRAPSRISVASRCMIPDTTSSRRGSALPDASCTTEPAAPATRIGHREDEPVDVRLEQRADAHRAWLDGREYDDAAKIGATQAAGCLAHDHHHGMGRWITGACRPGCGRARPSLRRAPRRRRRRLHRPRAPRAPRYNAALMYSS